MKKSTLFSGAVLSLGLGVLATPSVFAAPANTSFTDDVFYKCIIDAANQPVAQGGAGASLAVTDNITDEQLAAITEVVCTNAVPGSTKITDISGIEKLTGLETLDLSNNSIESADLSALGKLETLYINKNPLTSLVLPASILTVQANNGTGEALTVNATAAEGLESLDLEKSVLTAPLDLSKNVALQEIKINGTGLASLDLTKNTDLVSVQVSRDNIVLKIAAEFDAENMTLDLDGFLAPDGFLDPNYVGVGVDYYDYDATTKKITITNPDVIENFIQVGVHRIYVPIPEDLDVPSTSTGIVKDNPDTSTSDKLALGLSVLGIALLGVAVKAALSAKRA